MRRHARMGPTRFGLVDSPSPFDFGTMLGMRRGTGGRQLLRASAACWQRCFGLC